MSSIEFEAELHGEPTLAIPPEVAARLPKSGRATVVVLVQDDDQEDRQWQLGAYEQFMKDDGSEDSAASMATWPSGYFEQTAGALAGEDFERPPQGKLPLREQW